MNYLLALVGAWILAMILVPIIKKVAIKSGVIDRPDLARKNHEKPTPLLGGLAIFLAVSILILLFRLFRLADFSLISDFKLFMVILGGGLIMMGGFLDDKYNLKPWQQVIWPVAAALLAVGSGITIGYVTNPLGGPNNALLYLSGGLGAVISFVWLMGMMYTTKFLDGLDGLASGIATIAAILIFFLGLNWDLPNSATGILALIFAGATVAFLFFNWRPAKIFLGEGGSVYLGFMLGLLSIISGSKIATTLLVMGIPALDVLLVIIQRLSKKESPFSHADRKHLHYRLIDAGFSPSGAVLFLCLMSLLFGAVSVISQTWGKLIGLAGVIIFMTVLFFIIKSKSYDRNTSSN